MGEGLPECINVYVTSYRRESKVWIYSCLYRNIWANICQTTEFNMFTVIM